MCQHVYVSYTICLPVPHRSQPACHSPTAPQTPQQHPNLTRDLTDNELNCSTAEEVMFVDRWRLVAACSAAIVVLHPSSLRPLGLHLLTPESPPPTTPPTNLDTPPPPASPPAGAPCATHPSTDSTLPRSALQPMYHPAAFTAGAAAIAPVHYATPRDRPSGAPPPLTYHTATQSLVRRHTRAYCRLSAQ